jgi:hypothetical protein
MVYIISFGKDEMVTRQCETPPSEEIRARVRALKPSECSECEGRVLHGNGWRTRTILASWNDWDTVVWYWRVECQRCGTSHCLMPEIVIPDLQYGIEVVSEVVVGRYNGKSAKEFEPDRRTQKRWLDRIRSWWPVALSSGAVRGTLSEWTGSVSLFLDAVGRCAASHIGLFFPSLSERNKTVASARRSYPAIATHQSGSWILSAGL